MFQLAHIHEHAQMTRRDFCCVFKVRMVEKVKNSFSSTRMQYYDPRPKRASEIEVDFVMHYTIIIIIKSTELIIFQLFLEPYIHLERKIKGLRLKQNRLY